MTTALFTQSTNTVKYTLLSGVAATYDALSDANKALTDGYELDLSVGQALAVASPGSNSQSTGIVGCIINATDDMAAICGGCFKTKDASGTETETVSADFISDKTTIVATKAAAATADVALVGKTTAINSGLIISQAFNAGKTACDHKFFQPTEADTYSGNYRFGGMSAINVVGSFGTVTNLAATSTVNFKTGNTQAAAVIAGAVTVGASAVAVGAVAALSLF